MRPEAKKGFCGDCGGHHPQTRECVIARLYAGTDADFSAHKPLLQMRSEEGIHPHTQKQME